MEPLAAGKFAKGQRVMARIAVQKVDHHARGRTAPHLYLDKITDPHAQRVAIKVQTFGRVGDAQHDMTESHQAGLETRYRARGVKRRLEVHQRTVIGLARDSIRVAKLD